MDEAALWAKEYCLEDDVQLTYVDRRKEEEAVEEATLQGKSSMLSHLLECLDESSLRNTPKGLPGLVQVLLSSLLPMALKRLAKVGHRQYVPRSGNR